MKYCDLIRGDEIHILGSKSYATWILIDTKIGYNGINIGYNFIFKGESFKYLLKRDEYENLIKMNKVVVQRELEDNDSEGLFKALLSDDIYHFLREYAESLS